MRRNSSSFPALNLVFSILAIPYSFTMGFVIGLAAPVAVIAAMVAGVRFLTGKMPFLSLGQFEESGERRMSLELVPVEAAKELFAAEKQTVLDEIASLQEELKVMAQKAQEGAGQQAEAE